MEGALRRRSLGPARERGRRARLTLASDRISLELLHMDSHAVAMPVPELPASGLMAAAHRVEVAVGAAVEAVAAVVLVAEILILGAGVVACYVLHAPLVWSDELASILFLWLSMLGAAIALRRGEHMRMTGVVARVSPATRALLEAVAMTAAIAFLLLILPHALDYA